MSAIILYVEYQTSKYQIYQLPIIHIIGRAVAMQIRLIMRSLMKDEKQLNK